MRLLKLKIAALLMLCFIQSPLIFSQAIPPPPVPPPPPGLPIDDYIPYMIFIAVAIGVIYFLKNSQSKEV